MAISQAKSIEEIEQLNAMLRSGIIPTHIRQQQQQQQQPPKKTNGISFKINNLLSLALINYINE